MRRKRKNKNKFFINILLPAVLLFGASLAVMNQEQAAEVQLSDAPILEAHFIDVGQADSSLVRLPDGINILIDGGTESTAPELVRYLKAQNVNRIDILIATHPHEDHIGGLASVVKEFDIGSIYMPKVSHTIRSYERLLTAISDKGLKVNTAKAGVVLTAGDVLEAEFLSPVSDEYDNLNNYSCALKITYGKTAFLFMGDAEALAEKEILNLGKDISANVLKVGHHGSSTSSSSSFLGAVNPKIAVISCGKNNSYKHPSAQTLKRLEERSVNIYRTDEMGTIKISSDGNIIAVNQ